MATLAEFKYGYDQASNRLYRRDEVAHGLSAGFDELYGYDGLNRLTSCARGQLNSGNTAISGSPTLTQNWTLDPLGNWNRFQQGVVSALDQTREQDEVNEITDIDKTVGADWPTPAYDANGNTTSFPDPRSLTSALSATYDAWNRLVKLEDGGTVAEYQYDGANRRTVKTASSVTRHYYFSDQWQVLEERTGSSTSADRQYVWGQRYVDDLVLRNHDSTRLYALNDALFNVVALTDDGGAVVERFAYQPYGLSEELDPDFTTYSGTDYDWEYRFTGRELDLESGLQLNRNRYLHQQLGRWLTWDPIGYQEGSNLYLAGFRLQEVDPYGTRLKPGLAEPGWVHDTGCFEYCMDAGLSNEACEQFCGSTWPRPLPRPDLPIKIGEEGDENTLPDPSETDDGEGTCVCRSIDNTNIMRPIGTLPHAETPTPGLGNVKCRPGEKRVVKYYGECQDNPNASREDKCKPPGKCEKGSCFEYIIWECRNSSPVNAWQKSRTIFTKCE